MNDIPARRNGPDSCLATTTDTLIHTHADNRRLKICLTVNEQSHGHTLSRTLFAAHQQTGPYLADNTTHAACLVLAALTTPSSMPSPLQAACLVLATLLL